MISRQTLLVLLAVTLFGCLGGLAATLITPTQYQADAYVVVYDMPHGVSNLLIPGSDPNLTEIYQTGALQDQVISRTQQLLPGHSADEIKRAITIETVAYTPFTRVTATGPTANAAAALANAFGSAWTEVASRTVYKAYNDTLAVLQTRQDDLLQKIATDQQKLEKLDPASPLAADIQTEIGSWRDALTKTQSDIESLDIARLYVAGNAWVAIRAKAANAQRSPDPIKNLAVGLAAGLSLGILLALWLTSRRWHRVQDVRQPLDEQPAKPALAESLYEATNAT